MAKHLADYGSAPIDFVRGKGSYLFDKAGKKYLDFQTGWCVGTVGWKNREMADAISKQANEGLHLPPWFRLSRHETFATYLTSLAPKHLTRVFRACSGSEAVEFALSSARQATKKRMIVTIDGVYHGHTTGAGLVGNASIQKDNPEYIKLPMPRTIKQAQAVIEQFETLATTRNDIAAFFSEPIWTNAGCIIPPEGFYASIDRICKANGILLAMDEVATCMGRTGKMFASEHWDIKPDIITLGKSFTGGYATMAATLVTESVFKRAKGISAHPTFGWCFQDLAATEKNIQLIVRDNLVDNSRDVGAYLLSLLKPLETLKKVKEVRGLGMVLAIQFHLPIAPLIAFKCYKAGLVTEFTDAYTLFLSPMLNLSKPEAKKGAQIIASVCGMK